MTPKGLILAAPHSGSGKTTLTLGLLRALRNRAVPVRGAKSGPDHIDPAFHEAACGVPSMNLDAWAMDDGTIGALLSGTDIILIEGAMGLFDGAPPDGRGAVADLARRLGLPVVLVVDAGRMSHSIAPLVNGFANHDPDVRVAGVILNRVGSERHEKMLRTAQSQTDIAVFGALRRDKALSLPDRHLGLVQAREHNDLETFLNYAATQVEERVDIQRLIDLAAPVSLPNETARIEPFLKVKSVAIASDAAFSFCYPHFVKQWQDSGASLSWFSPLADQTVPEADLIFLPGGYPELHAERLSNAHRFRDSLKDVAQHSLIYGECGGYMTLGEELIDANGVSHKMVGLLPLSTSFAKRKLHLGYRSLSAYSGPLMGSFAAHEFHYATTVYAKGSPLFNARDAEGTELPPMGLRDGNVAGSFAHIIARSATR